MAHLDTIVRAESRWRAVDLVLYALGERINVFLGSVSRALLEQPRRRSRRQQQGREPRSFGHRDCFLKTPVETDIEKNIY